MNFLSFLKLNKKSARFKKYLCNFFISSAIIIILFEIVLMSYVTSALRRQLIMSNATILTEVSHSQEFILDEINKTFLKILSDSQFMNYTYNYYNRNYNTLRDGMQRFESFRLANDYIKSIAIYYYNDDSVLSTSQGYIPLDSYYDKDLIMQVKSGNLIAKNAIVRQTTLPNENKKQDFLITFVKNLPINYTDGPEMMVIFDVDELYLKNTVIPKNLGNDGIIVTNNHDEIIYSTNDGFHLYDVFSAENLKFAGGLYEAKIGGHKTLLSKYVLEKYNWNYYIITPKSLINRNSGLILYWSIVFCIGALFASFYISLKMTVKTYAPIKNISDIIAPQSSDSSKEDEVEFIHKNVVSLIDNNKQLSETLNSYLFAQKELFLKSILDGDYENFSSIKERMEAYNINIAEDNIFIIYYISLDNYDEFISSHSENQQSLFALYTNSIITDFLQMQKGGFFVDNGLNQMILVLGSDENITDDVRKRLHGIAYKLNDLICKNNHNTFTIGVSCIYKGFENIAQCYKEAKSSIEFRMIYEETKVILYENTIQINQAAIDYPFIIQRDIIKAIKMANRDNLSYSLDRFANYFKTNVSDNAASVRSCFTQLFSVSVHSIYDIDRSFDFSDFSFEEVYSSISSQETISGLLKCINELYDYFFNVVGQKKNIKNRQLISDIQAYIDTNLGSDTSIEILSKKFFISESYLRHIFKTEVGTNLKKYIDGRRMEKAKKLLVECPDKKITDIAFDIGYQSSQAFTSAFKLHVGMSPKAYRDEFIK